MSNNQGNFRILMVISVSVFAVYILAAYIGAPYQFETRTQIPQIKVTPLKQKSNSDRCIDNVKVDSQIEFSVIENQTLKRCIKKNAKIDKLRADSLKRLDWSITSSFHTFLKKKPDVKIVEIGGYVGNLVPKLVKATGVKTYVVLEPVPSFYKNLTERIQKEGLTSIVKAYNFGLGKKEQKLTIDTEGTATSLKKKKKVDKNGETIKIVNVVDFFVQFGLGCHRLDLLTINCEGCEFDVIEMLTSSSLVENIDYIQFQPHAAVFKNPWNYLRLYCSVRQFLARTHVVAYEYPHVWETWKRKGIS